MKIFQHWIGFSFLQGYSNELSEYPMKKVIDEFFSINIPEEKKTTRHVYALFVYITDCCLFIRKFS